ncbi:hypothetical protein BJ973_002043 [Actinoplanes tereljensis]|uniref:GGDEF domain-containing protein n=1 Tax=Paractinoplanes tereljensis TaxID=571912 RepID=A0A919NLB2_9ACTN|nr:GGDEF domain-containing protein [Actinoplanes tereljensis]GIF20051.1 hypothetical protein Ate02nite_27810 [Actinoplanes tereljensis]
MVAEAGTPPEDLTGTLNLADMPAEIAVDLHRMAFHDGLTGLANRMLLRDRTTLAVERAKRGSHAAVMLLDLDGFKPRPGPLRLTIPGEGCPHIRGGSQ